MATIRQQIMTAVNTRLAAATTANGFLTDAGDSTRINPDRETQPVSARVSVSYTVNETGGTHNAGMAGEDFCPLDLEIVGVAKDVASDNPDATARKIHDDMIAAIGSDKTWGGLADDTITKDFTVEPFQRKERVVTVTQKVTINFRTVRWDSSTAPS